MEREHNAIMANGKSPKYYVDKYCDKLEKEIEQRRLEERERLRREEERAKAQKDSSQGGDVRREVNLSRILTYERMKKLEFHVVPEEGYLSGYGPMLAELRRQCSNDPKSRQPTVVIDGQELVRPLTVRESLLARIEDYNRLTNPDGSVRTIQDRLRLFNKGFWTSAGMLYGYDGDPVNSRESRVPVRAKVSTICPELLRLTPNFNKAYVEVPDFNEFEGEEIDLSQGIWNTRLTQAQVPEHIGWRKLVGDDEEGGRILRDYVGIVFSEVQRLYGESKAMGFWKRSGINTNELRAPWVNDVSSRSSARGNYNLFIVGASVRVSQAPQR